MVSFEEFRNVSQLRILFEFLTVLCKLSHSAAVAKDKTATKETMTDTFERV